MFGPFDSDEMMGVPPPVRERGLKKKFMMIFWICLPECC